MPNYSGVWTLPQQMQAIASGLWPVLSDPYFEYVSLLLTGDGTNGAQNNTFLDSSSNAFTITRNGNTTQGTFSPYGNLWSNYFDGSGDYIDIASNAALGYGTGDFEISLWYSSAIGSGYLFDQRTANPQVAIAIFFDAGTMYVFVNGGTIISGTSPSANSWHYLTLSRVSGTTRLFVDGSQIGSNYSDSNNYGTLPVRIGCRYTTITDIPYNGYISNFRIIKGSGVSSQTVPTTPLTAVSGTSLLTCQSNRFIDNSSNNFTLTVNGNTSVQRFSPFNPTAPYSTATLGGSGYFDGTGDYLSLNGGTGISIVGDFTYEVWIYPTTVSPTYQQIVFGPSLTGPSYLFQLLLNGSTLYVWNGLSHQTAVKPNVWSHVALVRQSNTTYLYLNGIRSNSSATYTQTATIDTIGGASSGIELFNGYMSNARFVSSALYTSSFTPPTTPVTAVSGTSLLCNFTNAGIPDAAMMNDLETVGNAQVSTSVVKYGTGSLAFDGTGDYLLSNSATSDLYAFGSGNFTIEGWVYLNATQTSFIYDSRPTSTNGAYPCIFIQSNAVTYYVNTATAITGATLSNSTWYHIALCRSGTSTKLFVNGTQSGSTYTDSNVYLNSALRPVIGGAGYTLGTSNFNGYIDDLRITKGYARYTANFTPPTAALPVY